MNRTNDVTGNWSLLLPPLTFSREQQHKTPLNSSAIAVVHRRMLAECFERESDLFSVLLVNAVS